MCGRPLPFLLLLCAAAACAAARDPPALNNRPIIGILSQELTPSMSQKFGNHSSYIAASYVKYLEGAGARVVPIKIGQSGEYYDAMVDQLNGVLLPGGASYFDVVGGYADAGVALYERVLARNVGGDFLPLWGTCLGFELLTFAAAARAEHRTACNVHNQALPVHFEKGYKNSRMFEHLPTRLAQVMSTKNVMPHFHIWCVTEKNLTALGLMKDWKVLASNKNASGDEFISAIENRNYPLFGTIFHPEKIGYEWSVNQTTPHNVYAIKVMEYFANFFVNEARKNTHKFKSRENEEEFLIYRYQPTYTGVKTTFEQSYFFDY